MKVFDIQGKLEVSENIDHQAMLGKLFEQLKKAGIHFVGETKEIPYNNK